MQVFPVAVTLLWMIAGSMVWAASPVLEYPSAPIRSKESVDTALPAEVDEAIAREIRENIERLGLDETEASKDASALLLPLRPDAPAVQTDRHVVSNYFDHNPAFPGFVLDYACGGRSYDTLAGYNHQATDFVIWPFPWQGMAQNTMRVRAAASGVIVARVDGNPDRNCSLDSSDMPNLMAIWHFDGSVSRYLNLRGELLTDKQVGKTVTAGELLGVAGSSGASSVPHLSFELRNALDQPVDPYAGACNPLPGRWAEQPPYRDSRLLSVAPHSAPPLASPGCGEVERPNYRWRFAPGEVVYLAAYLRDLHRGDPLEVEVFRPDGSIFAQALLDTDGMDSEYYDAAHWYVSYELPEDSALGMWKVRYTYLDRSVEARFAVGGNGLRGTGAWYDPAQSGQGLVLEVIEGGAELPRVALGFYAYVEGEPVWMIGTAPLQGDIARVPLLIGSGANFPPAFRTEDLLLEPWGEMQIEFTGPDTLRADWTTSRPGFTDGGLSLQRLSLLADPNDDGFDSGIRACFSGSWYSPTESGYGLQVELVDTEQGRIAAVIWYVYKSGKPYWMNGAAPVPLDGNLTVPMEDGSGGQFPPDYEPDEVERSLWGEIDLAMVDSNTAILSWRTQRAGFPSSGRIALTRLTQTLEANCR